MSEDLKQAGGNEPLENPVNVQAQLSQQWHIYDLVSGEYLGRADRIHFTLDPWRPSLYALTSKRLDQGHPVDELLRGVLPK